MFLIHILYLKLENELVRNNFCTVPLANRKINSPPARTHTETHALLCYCLLLIATLSICAVNVPVCHLIRFIRVNYEIYFRLRRFNAVHSKLESF